MGDGMKGPGSYRRRQFPTKGLFAFALLALFVWRADPKGLPGMLKTIAAPCIPLPAAESAVPASVLVSVPILFKLQHKTHKDEILRMAKMRDDLQSALLSKTGVPHGK